MKSELAIIIPAYKARFLARTLESLAKQTCQTFTVYIGDDSSPEDISSIIKVYRNHLTIVYKRFDENLGRKDLAAHWNRCIDMADKETWNWLLPDDDVASPECVDTLLKQIEIDSNRKILYRFQSNHIDEQDQLIRNLPNCPPLESSVDFITRKLRFERNSSVAEYVFMHSMLLLNGKFISLPLAWGSDDMAWIKLGQENGIYTLPAGTVSLRQSSLNISNNTHELVKQKFEAKYQFLRLLLQDKEFLKSIRAEYSLQQFRKEIATHLFFEYKSYRLDIGFRSLFALALKNNQVIKGGYPRNIYRLLRYKLKNAR